MVVANRSGTRCRDLIDARWEGIEVEGLNDFDLGAGRPIHSRRLIKAILAIGKMMFKRIIRHQ